MSRSSKPRKLPTDINQLAAEIVRLSTEEPAQPKEKSVPFPISKYLAQIGRAGGLKGGKARAAKLSAKKRSLIAKKAAMTRWERQHESTKMPHPPQEQ